MVAGKRFDVPARKSSLTGEAVRQRLQAAHVPVEEFADVFGVPLPALRRMIEGPPNRHIPMLIEMALIYTERHSDELRNVPRPTHWPCNRTGFRLSVFLAGEEVAARLRAISWSVPDFARLTGLTDRTVRDIVQGHRDGSLTHLLELVLELVERYPMGMQALPRVQTPERPSRARKEALWHMARRTP